MQPDEQYAPYTAADPDGDNPQATEQRKPISAPADLLNLLIQSKNIAEDLDDSKLAEIGEQCARGYRIDKQSRSEWDRATESAIKLAKMAKQEKMKPWPGCANIIYPMITEAAIQFNARAYPAIVQPAGVVKGAIIGADPDGQKKASADRVAKFMSWQCTEQMQGWDEDTDQLLLELPIVGTIFRKTYFDASKGRSDSELVRAENLYVNHMSVRNIDDAQRITQTFQRTANQIKERQLQGIWRDVELSMVAQNEDDDAYYDFLECHVWLDLDNDGYKEPYCVTVYEQDNTVMRIYASYDENGVMTSDDGRIIKIKPITYYTAYRFWPNPDGGFYSMGLGQLLEGINLATNMIINQIIDNGTLNNTGGGLLGSGLKLKGGSLKIGPGEYKQVDVTGGTIRDNFMPLQFPSAGPVLFQLLGMLMESARNVSSIKDVLTGQQSQANVPATTTLALIEQGLKVFTGIYQRIHRSLKSEFIKLRRLNRVHVTLDQYAAIMDGNIEQLKADLQRDDTDIIPVSDPNLVADAQNLARAEALMKFKGDPTVNQEWLNAQYFQALKIDDFEKHMIPPHPPSPPPEAIAAQAQAETDKARIEIDRRKVDDAWKETEARISKINAETDYKRLESSALMAQLSQLTGNINSLTDAVVAMSARVDAHEKAIADSQRPPEPPPQPAMPPQGMPNEPQQPNQPDNITAGVSGMAGPPGNPMDAQVPDGLPPELAAILAGGGIPESRSSIDPSEEPGSIDGGEPVAGNGDIGI